MTLDLFYEQEEDARYRERLKDERWERKKNRYNHVSKNKNKPPPKLKFCMYGRECKYKHNQCRFAHSLYELELRDCIYNTCRNPYCRYLHHDEDKLNWYFRIGYTFNPAPDNLRLEEKMDKKQGLTAEQNTKRHLDLGYGYSNEPDRSSAFYD